MSRAHLRELYPCMSGMGSMTGVASSVACADPALRRNTLRDFDSPNLRVRHTWICGGEGCGRWDRFLRTRLRKARARRDVCVFPELGAQ